MECNDACLSGRLTGPVRLRYTPSGIPIAEFGIVHASMQQEAGAARKTEFEMNCMAVSDDASAIAGLKAGLCVKLEGFLAKRSMKSAEIVFHARKIELIG